MYTLKSRFFFQAVYLHIHIWSYMWTECSIWTLYTKFCHVCYSSRTCKGALISVCPPCVYIQRTGKAPHINRMHGTSQTNCFSCNEGLDKHLHVHVRVTYALCVGMHVCCVCCVCRGGGGVGGEGRGGGGMSMLLGWIPFFFFRSFC